MAATAAQSCHANMPAHPEEHTSCVICLDDDAVHEPMTMLEECKHVFHTGCLQGWLDQHSSCPVCRCIAVNAHPCAYRGSFVIPYACSPTALHKLMAKHVSCHRPSSRRFTWTLSVTEGSATLMPRPSKPKARWFWRSSTDVDTRTPHHFNMRNIQTVLAHGECLLLLAPETHARQSSSATATHLRVNILVLENTNVVRRTARTPTHNLMLDAHHHPCLWFFSARPLRHR
ncbi:uncharacterized protein MONBRDRAFT_6511 [Monosiga brevicollis MX1]|uniref:RING-type domain-containing protein n=1 Tax=Monosiga brevicollis TaxID=81824 RepID=A9UU38_MONBE|nr:uncharacterized protein MONBRDRAFT_6511 [Monosiga brevicollis MX1]EDQ91600.1 predicted protein [Monosiga brevicollis MX1]|eukprot:XP_001744022.1 hypothetical protein [Monosiga brevicollis MX1]